MEQPVEVAMSNEIKRNVGALQKLIVEMRELISSTDAQLVQQATRPCRWKR